MIRSFPSTQAGAEGIIQTLLPAQREGLKVSSPREQSEARETGQASRPGDNVYHGRVVRLCQLAGDEAIIDGFEFTDCFVRGPAVVVVQGETTFAHSTFRGDPESLLWEISPERSSVIGAILLTNCVFNECTFEGVGFAGPPEFIQQMKEGIGAE